MSSGLHHFKRVGDQSEVFTRMQWRRIVPSIHQAAPASVCASSEWSSLASQAPFFFFFFLIAHQMAVDPSKAARRPQPFENITSNHREKWAIKVLIPLNIFSAGVSASITHSRSHGYISCCNILQHHFEPWCIIKKNNEWSHGWPFCFFLLLLSLSNLLINSKMFLSHHVLIRGRAGTLFWTSCKCAAHPLDGKNVWKREVIGRDLEACSLDCLSSCFEISLGINQDGEMYILIKEKGSLKKSLI